MYAIFFVIFIQIVLEAFPVSSSGHLLLLTYLQGVDSYAATSSALDYFLHGPTIIAVAVLFFREWKNRLIWLFPLSRLFLGGNVHRERLERLGWKLMSLVVSADVATTALYFLVHYINKHILVGFMNSGSFLLFGFIVTGALLLSLLLIKESGEGSLSIKKAFLLGLVQGVALLPGISRLASRYVAARHMGITARRSFEISFLIFYPLMVAGFLKGAFKLISTGYFLSFQVMLAIFIAGIISFFALKLSRYLAHQDLFWLFGIYMLLPCFALLAFILIP